MYIMNYNHRRKRFPRVFFDTIDCAVKKHLFVRSTTLLNSPPDFCVEKDFLMK